MIARHLVSSTRKMTQMLSREVQQSRARNTLWQRVFILRILLRRIRTLSLPSYGALFLNGSTRCPSLRRAGRPLRHRW